MNLTGYDSSVAGPCRRERERLTARLSGVPAIRALTNELLALLSIVQLPHSSKRLPKEPPLNICFQLRKTCNIVADNPLTPKKMQPDGSTKMTAAPCEGFSYPNHRPGRLVIVMVLLLTTIVTTGGWCYYRHLAAEARLTTQESLSAIADLKAHELSNWMRERLGDAEVARMSVVVDNVVLKPKDPEAYRAAFTRVANFSQVYQYAAVVIANAGGQVLLKYPNNYQLSDRSVAEHARLALHSNKVIVSDLNRDRPGEPIYMWISCPVFDPQQPQGQPEGAVLMVVDPAKFLYPTIQKWPTPSKSGETLIVRREGEGAVYLNQLGHHGTKAPDLLPLSRLDSRSFVWDALHHDNEIIEGKDYRQVPVLAATRWIPDTRWLMVAKVDQDEVFAPLQQQAFEIGLMTALLLLAAGMGLSLIWRQQNLADARFNESRFRALIEQAPIAASITRNTLIVYANTKYLRQYGFQSIDELVGSTSVRQWAPEFREIIRDRSQRRMRGEPVPVEYEGIGQRKDGSQFPVHIAAGSVQLPDGPATLAFLTDITERKQAEEALKLFRALADRANDVIEVLDPQTGRYLDVNEKACQIHGYLRDEYLNRSVFDLDPEIAAGGQTVWEAHVAKLQQNDFLIFESVHQRKDGSVFPVEINASFIRLERDYLLAVVRDITERKRTEQHVRRMNRVYAMLSGINVVIVRERNPQAMFAAACRIAVEKGGFLMAWIGMHEAAVGRVRPVASAGRLDGYLEALKIDLHDPVLSAGPTGRAFLCGGHQISNDIEQDRSMLPWREMARQRGYRSSATFPLKAEGTVAGVLTLYSAEKDFFDADELALLDELAEDISFAMESNERETRRLQAEQLLRASERQFATAFEHAAIGMALVGINGQWLKVNRALCQILGYTAAELNATTFQEITHPEDLSANVQTLRQLLAGEMETCQMEKRYLHKDGRVIWAFLSISLVRDDFGLPVHLISQIQDISARRIIEEQFRQVQKMEAVGQLAGGVAHDYNNILAAAMIHLGMLLATPDMSPDMRDTLLALKRGADRAANLTRQLLVFSRRQAMQKKRVELNALLDDEIKMLGRLLGENIDVSVQPHQNEAWIEADAGMIEQVIMNLCINARDAMLGGGRLTVGVSPYELAENAVPPHVDARPGHFFRLAVRDNGCGMSPEIQQRIFEPFFTTKEVGKGTGLGLATVYGIVQQHQGWVEVTSEVGKGSEFCVMLPASAKTGSAGSASSPETVQRGTGNVLVVEDEESVRQALVGYLRSVGYQVHAAADSREALAGWKEKITGIDLLITDMIMPGGMNGLKLADGLKAINPKLQVIIMSGYSKDILKSGIPAGSGYIFQPKPCAPAILAAIVRERLSAASAPTGAS